LSDVIFARNNQSGFTPLNLITAPSAGPLSALQEAPTPARVDRAALHDAVLADLRTLPEALAHAEPYYSSGLPCLHGSDPLGPQGRSPKIADPPRFAVDKLLATL
jgi:hypothetical protein